MTDGFPYEILNGSEKVAPNGGLNLNDPVQCELTEAGARRINDVLSSIVELDSPRREAQFEHWKAGETYTAPLWCILQDFGGNHSRPGQECAFKNLRRADK